MTQEAKEAWVGTFHVTYATGKQFTLTGEFRLMEPFPGSSLPVPVVITNGVIQALDPRAVVRDAAGVTLFVGCSTEQLIADTPSEVGCGAGKVGVVAGNSTQH
jgi:hypothetical protein